MNYSGNWVKNQNMRSQSENSSSGERPGEIKGRFHRSGSESGLESEEFNTF